MKDYKSNINYFTKWEGMKTLGMCMLIVGIASLWLPMSYFMYIAGAALVVFGAIFFFLSNMGRSSESDIMTEINRRKEGIEFPEIESERDLQKRTPQRPEILDFEGFCYREGLYLKKMKNGSTCSSEYAKARMFILTDAFYIKTRTFSLVAEDERNETVEIPFAAVQDIVVESERKAIPCGKKCFSVVVSQLVITYDGDKKLRLIAKDDAYTDETITKLKKLVKTAQDAQ